MQESTELRAVIAGWFDSLAEGDPTWVDRHISHNAGTSFIGTDPDEWMTGENVATFLKAAVLELAGGIQVSAGNIEAYQEGSVGWGFARPTFTLPDGNRVPLRWSGVFHHEDGEWKLVQAHGSVGVSNEELLGMTFDG